MKNLTELQLHALSELFDKPEMIQNSLKLWGESTSSQMVDFENWKTIITKASLGDEENINLAVRELTEDEPKEHMAVKASGDGKDDFWWGSHTKNGVWRCFAQKLWISHKTLSKASNLTDLAALIAAATSNPAAGAAIATIAIAFFILKKFDKGRGVYIHWEPGPLFPGGPCIPPTTIRGQ